MSNIICAAYRMATAAELVGPEIPIQQLKIGDIYYCRYWNEPKLYQIVVEGFTRSEGQKHAAIRYLEPHPVFDTLTVPVEVPDVGPNGHFLFFERLLTAEEKALGKVAGNVIEHGTGLPGSEPGPANTVRKFLGVQPSDRGGGGGGGGGGSGTRGGRRRRRSRSKSQYRRKNKTRRI